MPGTRHPLLCTSLVLAVAAAGCSSGSKKPTANSPHQPLPVTTTSSPYEVAVLADGARALFTLRDADGLEPGDQVSDLGPTKRSARVIGGPVSGTPSPMGSRAALFLRGGRIATPLSSGLAGTDTFSLELLLRADACTSAWGRVLGTSSYGTKGREGLEVLHYPVQFTQSSCRLGVEFWHLNKLQAGCFPTAAPEIGRWTHLAIVYGAKKVTCYRNGSVIGSQAITAVAPFTQPGPLGLGGSGSGYQGPADGVSLSEVAVYARELTVAQVRSHVRLLRESASAAPSAGPSASAGASATTSGATPSPSTTTRPVGPVIGPPSRPTPTAS